MKMTFRWYGEKDCIPLNYIKQIQGMTGVVTAVPLVLFSYGANLLPLNVLGFFQYISPTIGLLLGIFFFHESFGMAQISALGFVWAAIVLFTVAESLRGR